MEASASETLKKVSYTTRTYNVDEWGDVTITQNLSFTDNWAEDTNKYNVAVTITPVYNSVSLSFLNSDDEFDNVTVTDSQMLKRLNKKTSIIYFNKYESLSPVYGNDGLVSSFSKNISSVTAANLNELNFNVKLPDSDDIKSNFTELSNVNTIYSVQYSVKFQVTASVSLASGKSLNVKLNKTSISGYVNYIDYLSGIVADQQGNFTRLIALEPEFRSRFSIYPNLLCTLYLEIQLAGSFYRLGDNNKALSHLLKAFSIGEKDGLAVPFAENGSFIRPLLEQVTDTSHQPFIRRIFSLHDLLEQSKAAISHNASLSQRPDCLTDNEWTLAKLAASRLSNREIAAEMGFSEGTVKQYLNRIYGKLHIEGDNRNKRWLLEEFFSS